MHQVLFPALAGMSAIALWGQPAIVQASPLDHTHRLANRITVRLNADSSGSGVIVSRQGTTHYVLTAKHVATAANLHSLTTADRRRHPITRCCLDQFPQVDLALLTFESDIPYPTATLAYPQTQLASFIFIYGYPTAGLDVLASDWRFRAGTLLNTQEAFLLSDRPFQDGYELLYNNIGDPGMSGGPILDADGRVIGIHGRSDGLRLYDPHVEQIRRLRIGISAGIPIQTFLQNVPPALRSQLRIDDSPLSRFSIETGEKLTDFVLASPVGTAVPQDPISLVNYSNSLYRIGRLSAALTTIEQAIQLDENFPDAWYFKGIILADLGEYAAAQAAFQQAIAIAPNYFMALRQQSLALTQLGRYQEALVAIEQALQLRPQSYVNWYLKGELLQIHLNQPRAARQAYNTALELNPNFPPALQGYLQTHPTPLSP